MANCVNLYAVNELRAEIGIVDGWKVVEDLRNDCPEFFNILCEFHVPFREFDEKNETFAEAPLIECNLDGSIKSFRFSNQLMQMIRPNKKGILDFYKAYHEISSRVFNPKYQSTFRLNSGEVLIVASLRVLHARESFVPNGKRHLQDAYFVFDNAANNIVHLLELVVKLSNNDISRVIEMAWEDRTPFEAIEEQFDLSHDQVVNLMRANKKRF